MEKKSLDSKKLEAVTGGQNYSCGWDIGERVSITSGSPQCPDCGEPLTSAGYYPERGYDAFKCTCGKYYVHVYEGDAWYRAYPIR